MNGRSIKLLRYRAIEYRREGDEKYPKGRGAREHKLEIFIYSYH
jgi:hypothetical protein